MARAVIFDWGNTLMREIPIHLRPSARSQRVELVPGVTDALEEIYQRYVCCVASNARGPEATTLGVLLENSGLDRYFQRLFTSHDIGHEKASPEFYHEVVRELKMRPDECIMVGDDYASDITGAKSVGIRTIWFTGTNPREVADADVIIHSMDELAPAITRIDSRG